MATSSETKRNHHTFHIAWPRLFPTLRGLSGSDWSREILAGVTLAALVIPLNIGYADVAGLPPSVGLYAGIVPMIAYAIFATSRHVIGSPDAAIAALIGSLLAVMAVPGTDRHLELAFALALVCAVFFLLFWLFRLGFLANYLSRAVLIGLITGLGIEVLFSQIRKMMGVQVEAEGFFRELLGTIQAIPETNWYALALGLGSIAIIRLLKRYAPKLPGALVALVVMTLVVSVFNLTEYGVSVLGEIPAGLPQLTVPRATFREWVLLIPGALAIVAMTLAEGLLLARSYAQKYDYRIDPDQEEFAYGAGNVAAAFTGAMALGSSASRTAAIDDTGAKTQWPSIVSAGIVALVLVFFTDQLALLPSAVLAGIVANSVLKLIDIQAFRELLRLRPSEFAIAVICTLGLLALGTIPGLAIAFLLTTIEMVRRAARPRTAMLEPSADGLSYQSMAVGDHSFAAPGIVVYRFGGPVFFANSGLLQSDVADIVAAADGMLQAFVLDAEAINDIDTTGVEALEGIISLLRANDIALAVSRANRPVPELLRHYGLLDEIGEDKLFNTNREAVAALQREQRQGASG